MTRAIHRISAGRGRRLAAGLVAVFAAIWTVVIPVTAAHADDLSDLTIVDHVCKDIGHDSSGVHGILCTDLAYKHITNGLRFYEVTEAYCQNASGYVGCLDNNVYLGLYSTGAKTAIYRGSCGPNSDPCAAGKNFYFLLHFDIPNGSDWEIWGITFGDPNIGSGCCQSSIDLPGGRVKLNGNLQTPHLHVNP